MDINYKEVFPKRRTFLAVVHVKDEEQTLQNVRIAEQNGADGAFLINHEVRPAKLLSIYAEVRTRFPTYWLGLNMLGMNPVHVLQHMPDPTCGLWTDNAGIDDTGVLLPAEDFLLRRMKSSWRGLYFGGVAFKGQRYVKDVRRVARLAIPYVDVITTSGLATGVAADPGKIHLMKHSAPMKPLAIASGVTPENVYDYPWADCFLVATGVSNVLTDDLEPKLVREMTDKLERWPK